MYKLIFGFVFIFHLSKPCFSQDMMKVKSIDSNIVVIKATLNEYKRITKDSISYSKEEATKYPDTIRHHKECFFNKENGSIEKIIYKNIYRQWTTIITVYYQNHRPVKFTNQAWYLNTIKEDFDIYYFDDIEVYQIKRDNDAGKPFAPTFLKWCYQFLNEK